MDCMKALEIFWQVQSFTIALPHVLYTMIFLLLFKKKSKSKFIYMSSYVHFKIIIKALQ